MANLPDLESLIITVQFYGPHADKVYALPENHGRCPVRPGIIALYLKPHPKDISNGFVFGSDSRSCDVLLANNKGTGVSGNHFSIQLDWETRNPVLTCLSRNYIEAETRGKNAKKVLSKGAWQVLKRETSTSVQVTKELRVLLTSPKRGNQEFDSYDRNVQEYLRDFKNAVPELANISLQDTDVTPFIMYRCPGLEGTEYYATQKIETGDPDYDSNVSLYYAECRLEAEAPMTAQEVAGIDFALPEYSSHVEEYGGALDLISNKAREGRADEVYVVKHFRPIKDPLSALPDHFSELRRLSHLHINLENVVDIITGTSVFMTVVNVFSQRTLHSLHQEHPLSTEEAGFVMGQIFAALAYLHSAGVSHDNLDPRSVLILSRTRLFVKLADTALSDYVDLGKPKGYHAIYASQYSSMSSQGPMDMWSAGVVALQLILANGLPYSKDTCQSSWVRKLQRLARDNHRKSNNDATALVESVLQYTFSARPKATEVLQHPWIVRTKGVDAAKDPHYRFFSPQGSRHTTPGPSDSFSRRGSASPSSRSLHQSVEPRSRHTSVGPSRRYDLQASAPPPESSSNGEIPLGFYDINIRPSNRSDLQALTPSPKSTRLGDVPRGSRHSSVGPSYHSDLRASVPPPECSRRGEVPFGSRHSSVGPSHRSDLRASAPPPGPFSYGEVPLGYPSYGEIPVGSRYTSVGTSHRSSRHSSSSGCGGFIDWSQCEDLDPISGTKPNNRSRSTSTDPAIRTALQSRPYPGDEYNDFDSESEYESAASQSTQFTANPFAREPDLNASYNQYEPQSRPGSSSPHSRSRRNGSVVGDRKASTSGWRQGHREAVIEEDSGEETETDRHEPVKKKRRSGNGGR